MQHKTQYIPGSAGIYIDSLLFIGNQGVYGPYGGDGGDSFASERPGKCFTELIIFVCWPMSEDWRDSTDKMRFWQQTSCHFRLLHGIHLRQRWWLLGLAFFSLHMPLTKWTQVPLLVVPISSLMCQFEYKRLTMKVLAILLFVSNHSPTHRISPGPISRIPF